MPEGSVNDRGIGLVHWLARTSRTMHRYGVHRAGATYADAAVMASQEVLGYEGGDGDA